MDEILYELRDHCGGLNAGRWDYIFSRHQAFRSRRTSCCPTARPCTMTVPFMRAYTELLVKTCHARGAHAMGGMAAFIPSRRDEDATASALEAGARRQGARGRRRLRRHLGGPSRPGARGHARCSTPCSASGRTRSSASATRWTSAPRTCSTMADTPGEVTEAGLRSNVNVGIQYISSWLRGNGAAAIYGLMEDAATAEISRSQVWQWIRHGVRLDDGRHVTPELVRELEDEELEKIRAEIGDDDWFGARAGRPVARAVRAGGAGRRVRGVPHAAGVRAAAAPRAVRV